MFSGNPTLQGVVIDGLLYQGDTSSTANLTARGALFSTNETDHPNILVRKCCNAVNSPGFVFLKGRGTAASTLDTVSGDNLFNLVGYGFEGAIYYPSVQLAGTIDGTVSSGIVPGRFVFNTANASGVLTEGLRINSSQVVTIGGASTAPALKVTPVASQARWIEVTAATSSGNPTIGVSGGILAISASVAITGVVSTSGYTVATLPAGTVGDRAYVTDALAPAYGVAVAGGGAVTIPVFYNGAAWICA